MDKYYYFVSQMPFLNFNQKTYIDREHFLAEAQKWLSPSDFITLCRADINDFYSKEGDAGLLKDYKDFEKALRQDAALSRRAAVKKEYRPSGVLEASALEGNPLEVEKKLLFLRWRFIEEKEESDFFSLKFVICYFLKLQVLKRLFSFDKEKGTAVFDSLCEVNNA